MSMGTLYDIDTYCSVISRSFQKALKIINKEYMKLNESKKYKIIKQKPYCCVPACISMILERNGFTYEEQEEIGYDLGLTVSPKDAHLFKKIRVSDMPPTSAGYGTQIQKEEYSLNSFFKAHQYPFEFTFLPIYTKKEFETFVNEFKENDNDAIVCFSYGMLYDTNYFGGHASVFEGVKNDKIMLIDPKPDEPDKRIVETDKLLKAMEYNKANYGGIWLITRLK